MNKIITSDFAGFTMDTFSTEIPLVWCVYGMAE